MWFQRGKLAQAATSSNVSIEWLVKRLDCPMTRLRKIIGGQGKANRYIARGLLEVFGYDAVVTAIDWRRTRYAG